MFVGQSFFQSNKLQLFWLFTLEGQDRTLCLEKETL